MLTPIFFENGATPRQLISTLMNICTDHPEMMDVPIAVFRPQDEDLDEYFEIGTVESVYDNDNGVEQILFES